MTTVEALASGTAVIAADRGGLGEVARGHAYMIRNRASTPLPDAIRTVLSDDDFARTFADGRANAAQRCAGTRSLSRRWMSFATLDMADRRSVGDRQRKSCGR